jgi:hypothetical protein
MLNSEKRVLGDKQGLPYRIEMRTQIKIQEIYYHDSSAGSFGSWWSPQMGVSG